MFLCKNTKIGQRREANAYIYYYACYYTLFSFLYEYTRTLNMDLDKFY